MRKKQYNKSKYIICLTLIIVLGLIGSSFAIWSDSIFMIGNISIGSLLADVEVNLINGDEIIVKKIIKNKVWNNGNNHDNIDEIENNQKENNFNNKISEDEDQNSGNQYGKIEYTCNYETLQFNIVRTGTVPLLLESCEVYLNSINISKNNILFIKNVKNSEIIDNGSIEIEIKKLEDLEELITGENNELIVNFLFRQSNLKNGGWIKEESIRIPISKVVEEIDVEKNNKTNDNNETNDKLIENSENEYIKNEEDENEILINEDNYSLLDDNDNESRLIDNDNNEISNDIENDVIEDNVQDNIEENIDGGDGNEF